MTKQYIDWLDENEPDLLELYKDYVDFDKAIDDGAPLSFYVFCAHMFSDRKDNKGETK